MRILWLNWKDKHHPLAGGAEVVLHEVMERQVSAGHEVTLLTARYAGSAASETMDGVRIVRVGKNRYVHSLVALWHYLCHMHNRFDFVIEMVNTAPYFAILFPGRATAAVFYHQLAREIWYYEMPHPISSIGYYLLEPLATRLLAMARPRVLSVSESTSRDLVRYGHSRKRIHPITEGLNLKPINTPADARKFSQPTLLSIGAIRPMKHTLAQIQAFELIRAEIPDARLIVAGKPIGAYGEQVLQAVKENAYSDSIQVEGQVSPARRLTLMRRSHVLLMTSVKEGWGLVVSEANSQGSVAVAYDADGLRDSIINKVTGMTTARTPSDLAGAVIWLLRQDNTYRRMQSAALTFSKRLTFEQTYQDVQDALGIESGRADGDSKKVT